MWDGGVWGGGVGFEWAVRGGNKLRLRSQTNFNFFLELENKIIKPSINWLIIEDSFATTSFGPKGLAKFDQNLTVQFSEPFVCCWTQFFFYPFFFIATAH